MINMPRGFCLIINNSKFKEETRLSKRSGSDVDVQKLKSIFNFLHFDVKIVNDLATHEIKVILKSISWHINLKRHDAFLCIVMSHGSSGDLIFGVDGTSISVHNIVKYFNDKNCLGLRGKPKLFFINACRGGNTFLQFNLIKVRLILI